MGVVRWRSCQLHEAVVERETVANRVLPATLLLSIIGKVVHDELIDFVESAHSGWRALNRHDDHGDVRQRWLRIRRRRRVWRYSDDLWRCVEGRGDDEETVSITCPLMHLLGLV